MTSKPLVIAHRGRPLPLPENSVASIAAAYAQCADAVEIDVRSSLGGRAVLMHDWHLRRTAYAPYPVLLTPALLRRWVRLRGGGRMPLLSEALAVVPEDKLVVLDVKEARAVAPALAAAAAVTMPVEVWSGRPPVLERAAKLAAEVPRVLYRACASRNEAMSLIGEATRQAYQGVCLSWRMVAREVVEEASGRGLRVYSEETDLALLAGAVEAGLDGIVTDRPAEVRAKLAALRAVSS